MEEKFHVLFQDGRYGVIEDTEEKIAEMAEDFPNVIFYRKEPTMCWVWHTQFEGPPVIEQVLEEFNNLEELPLIYPDAIYFYADLTTDL